MSFMGLDKNQLKLATEPLLWNYCENSTKMIIFKLISIGIKQNLGLWCSKFYSRGQNKIIIIIIIKFIYNFWFLAKSGGSFEPSRLAIELSLYMCVCVCVCVCENYTTNFECIYCQNFSMKTKFILGFSIYIDYISCFT